MSIAIYKDSVAPGATEDSEQKAVIDWRNNLVAQHARLRWLFHVPNGGYRAKSVARMLQAMGVSPGVPDLWLPQKVVHASPSARRAVARAYGKVTPETVATAMVSGVITGLFYSFSGLAIEMKVRRNTTSDAQDAWLLELSNNGWQCAVCYSARTAISVIASYLYIDDAMM